jgi:DNA-binding NarL/FixJ family response regulator
MATSGKIRILTVDDHPLFREGIAAFVNNQTDMSVVAEAATGGQALLQFREHRPDLTLMDLRLPDMSGIDTVIALRGEFPDARIMMLTTFDGDIDVRRALAAGARGYMLKSMPTADLLAAIRQVNAGIKRVAAQLAAQLAEHIEDDNLTKREMEVLRHIAGGNRNKSIAHRLFIAEDTVKAHIRHIMSKLGASDRTQAVAIGVRRGFIELGQ